MFYPFAVLMSWELQICKYVEVSAVHFVPYEVGWDPFQKGGSTSKKNKTSMDLQYHDLLWQVILLLFLVRIRPFIAIIVNLSTSFCRKLHGCSSKPKRVGMKETGGSECVIEILNECDNV